MLFFIGSLRLAGNCGADGSIQFGAVGLSPIQLTPSFFKIPTSHHHSNVVRLGKESREQDFLNSLRS